MLQILQYSHRLRVLKDVLAFSFRIITQLFQAMLTREALPAWIWNDLRRLQPSRVRCVYIIENLGGMVAALPPETPGGLTGHAIIKFVISTASMLLKKEHLS